MRIASLLAITGLATTALADCLLENKVDVTDRDDYHEEELCTPQGEGDWTFSMYTSEVEVPTFNGGNPNAGYRSSKAFLIYDEGCELRGVYAPGHDCGTPFVIQDFFLTQVLTIDKINFDADGYFRFEYGDGRFSIGNNGCECQDMVDGLRGAQGCKCAFPIDGTTDGDYD